MLTRRQVFSAAALPLVASTSSAVADGAKEYRKARVGFVMDGSCTCVVDGMVVSFDVRGNRKGMRRALMENAEIELEIVRHDLRWDITGVYSDGARLPIRIGNYMQVRQLM